MAIEVQRVQQLVPGGVRTGADLQSAVAPYRAAEQLGVDLQNTSKMLSRLAHQKQHAENVANIQAAEVKMDQAFASAQVSMAELGDEKQWTPLWEKTWADASKNILSEDLAPVVREELALKMEEFKSRSDIRIASQVTQRTIQRSRAKVKAAVEHALEDGDLGTAQRRIKEGEAARLLNPEEAAEMLSRAESRIDDYEVRRLIASDPEAAYAGLTDKTPTGQYRQYKNLTPAQRDSLTASARRENGQAQSEFYADLAFKTAEDGPVSVDLIQDYVDTGRLTKQQGAAYIREFHSPTLHKLDPRKMAEVLRDIEAYDQTQDPFFEDFAQLHARLFSLPSKQATLLLSRLQQKSKNAMGTNSTGDMVMKRLNAMFSANYFNGGSEATVPEDQVKEAIAFLEATTALNNALTQNPKLSPTEAFEIALKTPGASKVAQSMADNLLGDLKMPPVEESLGAELMKRSQSNVLGMMGVEPGMDERDAIKLVAERYKDDPALQRAQLRIVKEFYATQ